MNKTNRTITESPDNECLDSLASQASERFQWHWEELAIAGEIRKLAVASDPEGMLIDACERQDAGEQGVVDPFWACLLYTSPSPRDRG